MIEKPYPVEPGYARYQFARTAKPWKADIEAKLAEAERPTDWADGVIALADSGMFTIDSAIAGLGALWDHYA